MKFLVNACRWLRWRLFGGAYLPLPTRINIHDPMAFLAPAGVTPDSMLVDRAHDWPLPVGYEICDCVRLDQRTALQTFVMQPFDVWDYNDGDGGQVAEVGNDGYVRFVRTRDGGKPFTQFFNGETGWIVFGVDAGEDRWRTVIARLCIGRHPGELAPQQDLALTRYRRATIELPFAVNGARTSRSLVCIVSEHYDADTVEKAQHLERSWFAAGVGLVRWEAWDRTAPTVDLSERYFPIAFSNAPGPGWQIEDVRTWTNIVTEPVPVPVPPMI
jgi:hypothetical protein